MKNYLMLLTLTSAATVFAACDQTSDPAKKTVSEAGLIRQVGYPLSSKVVTTQSPPQSRGNYDETVYTKTVYSCVNNAWKQTGTVKKVEEKYLGNKRVYYSLIATLTPTTGGTTTYNFTSDNNPEFLVLPGTLGPGCTLIGRITTTTPTSSNNEYWAHQITYRPDLTLVKVETHDEYFNTFPGGTDQLTFGYYGTFLPLNQQSRSGDYHALTQSNGSAVEEQGHIAQFPADDTWDARSSSDPNWKAVGGDAPRVRFWKFANDNSAFAIDIVTGVSMPVLLNMGPKCNLPYAF
jgi:hypothetical protein